MSADLSLLHLITRQSGGAIGDADIDGGLAVSWTRSFRKWTSSSRRCVPPTNSRALLAGGELGAIYKQVTARRGDLSGMESIFEAGFKEFARLRKQTSSEPMSVLEGAQRVMRVALSREIDQLETHPVVPRHGRLHQSYVGLFGTVWGIMGSFRSLGNVQQATLAMVAPGIAEALVATAPACSPPSLAVVAYNATPTTWRGCVNRL